MPPFDSPSDLSANSGESPAISPSPTPEAGIGSLMIKVPDGMDIPDSGTITLTYSKAPADPENGSPTGEIELTIESVEDVKPDGEQTNTPPTREQSFEATAKQVRGSDY